jgi:hypothetical protein
MITCPGGQHARCVGRDALPQSPHRDAADRAPGAVDRPGDRALVRRRQALRPGELADGTLSSSGART